MRIGVDTGGTFTDFVVLDGDVLRIHKCLSTPDAPERSILDGLASLGTAGSGAPVVHGSTVATNAVLEGQGARTALVTSIGFADMLTIGRQARRALYDLQPEAAPPPVPQELCFESGGRVTPTGEVLEPLDEAGAAAVAACIDRAGAESVAICLLFSFIDDRFERMLEAAMPDGVSVSRSSAVLPEYREYERGIATWLNARIGPLMAGYLQRLQDGIGRVSLTVMQSSGGTVAASRAAGMGVHLLLSGPAGGVAGAGFIGRMAGHPRLLTLDMGGTSTDVCLVDGDTHLTSEGRIAHYPVAVPMVDLHTIGAGGGSIAWLDAGGALKVGPRSAGADPGPACYGRGGRSPTVTDANLVLGRLPASTRLGGSLELDPGAARDALATLAGALDMPVESAAEGIIRIADEHMAQALRVISVERGEDPRAFTLFPFGGAAGLHACSLADALGMRQILAPVNAGVLSALGMLVSPRAREVSRTHIALLDRAEGGWIGDALDALTEDGLEELVQEGVEASSCSARQRLDLRYAGQSFTLEVEWSGDPGIAAAQFGELHERRYGHRLDAPVELVNLRVRVEAPSPDISLPHRSTGTPVEAHGETRVYGIDAPVPVFMWASLPAGQRIDGPALVTAQDSTLWVATGWSAAVDAWGNLDMNRDA